MVNLTFLEINLDGASIDLPFGGTVDTETTNEAIDDVSAESDRESENSSGKGKLAVLGVLLVLVAIAAVVKYISGDDSPDVDIDTDEERLEVTVDE